jgi:hypothetical protein
MAVLTPSGKKRYHVTLTPAIVERFQSLCKEFGLPPQTMSHAIDDCLRDLASVFQTAKDQGKFDLSDIFKLMGKQVELFMEEEKEERRKREEQKRNIINH